MSDAPDLDRARDRWCELHVPGALAALEAERRAAVCTVVWRTERSEDHVPRPYWSQQLGQTPAHDLPGPPAHWPATRVGLDAEGRPVIAEHCWSDEVSVMSLLTWDDDTTEVATPQGHDRLRDLEHYAFRDGRPVAALQLRASDDPHHAPTPLRERYVYDADGRARVALELSGPYADGRSLLRATRFTHDADGRLALVDWINVTPPPGDDPEAVLDAALALRVPEDYDGTPSVVWDGRRLAHEPDLPAPGHALDDLAAPLAAAIRAAVAAVAHAVPAPVFAVVDLVPFPNTRERDYALVRAAVAGRAGRDRARRATEGPDAVLRLAYEARKDMAELDLLDAASPELRRALRAALQTYRITPSPRPAAVTRLATELAAALAADPPPGVAEGFVAIVRASDADGTPDQWGELPEVRGPAYPASRSALGDTAVDAFLATLVPPRKEFGTAFAALAPEDQARVAELLAGAGLPPGGDGLAALATEPGYATEIDVRVPGRPALAALLTALGLPGDEAATVAADARWGIVLEPGGDGATRLGGRPVLPEDVTWPTADGRALTHLATLALDELPAIEGRDALPPDGHLAFFADISEAGELYDIAEPGDDRLRVVHAPASTTTHEPSPPGGGPPRGEYDPPVLLDERRVRPVPRLQLRHGGHGWAMTKYGIDAVGDRLLERLVAPVNGDGDHQLLGFPWVVQEDSREDDEEVLLHVAYDEGLGFSFLDGGDLMFYGNRDELRSGRLDRIALVAGSC
jgi:hypothetical protein